MLPKRGRCCELEGTDILPDVIPNLPHLHNHAPGHVHHIKHPPIIILLILANHITFIPTNPRQGIVPHEYINLLYCHMYELELEHTSDLCSLTCRHHWQLHYFQQINIINTMSSIFVYGQRPTYVKIQQYKCFHIPFSNYIMVVTNNVLFPFVVPVRKYMWYSSGSLSPI